MSTRADYTRKSMTLEHAKEKAERLDCDIEYSHEWILQLDLDSDEAFETFKQQLVLLEDIGVLSPGTTFEWRDSKNGNKHVTVNLDLDEMYSVEQRILLQALLGSDLKREALSYARVLQGMPAPILLFRPRNATYEVPPVGLTEEPDEFTF